MRFSTNVLLPILCISSNVLAMNITSQLSSLFVPTTAILPNHLRFKIGMQLLKQGRKMINTSEERIKQQINQLKTTTLQRKEDIQNSVRSLNNLLDHTPNSLLNKNSTTTTNAAAKRAFFKDPHKLFSHTSGAIPGPRITVIITFSCLLTVLIAASHQIL